MPADIRSFFGGKSSQGSASSPTKPPAKKEKQTPARNKRGRKVVNDSDDDDDVVVTDAPVSRAKPSSKSKPEVPEGEPTTASDYFASSKKKGRTPKSSNADTNNKSSKSSSTKTESPEATVGTAEQRDATRAGSRRDTNKATVRLDDEKLGDDDIFATEYGKAGKGDDDYKEEEDDDDSDAFDPLAKPVNAARGRPVSKKRSALDEDDEDVIMEDAPRRPASAAKPATSQTQRKRKSEAVDKDDDDIQATSKSVGTGARSKKPKASTAKQDQSDSKEIQDIFDSIPTIKAPSPPPPQGSDEKKKFVFGGGKSRDPVSGGAELPVGAENCLAGLTFVFTGVLDTLGREEGQALVKRYGGKVTTAPSGKTSFVVLGSDAGPSKLATISKHKLKTISEEGLFELIRRLPANGGDGKAAEKYEAKKKEEDEKIRKMAAEIDAEEKRNEAERRKEVKSGQSTQDVKDKKENNVDDQLWTSKYAPTSLNMICGNKGAVEKLQAWLRNWRKSAKANFTKPGKDGSGLYRSVMIHGPPGIGKTTAAHLVAKLEGYDVVESNASDTRSKKLVESGLLGVLDTTSLQGYFSTSNKKVESGKKNLVLIMDEVDGMSAGDRGGVGAMAAIAKKTQIPLILICNERRLPKMKPFDHVTFEIPFRRPTVEQIRARLLTICFREKMKIPPQVLDSLIEGTHADIRQVINMLSAVRLDRSEQGDQSSQDYSLDYDQGKQMSKAWEKHIILKPWDIVGKILNPQMFSQSSTATLNDKSELYFNDHEFSYLMLQENYLRTKPTRANNYEGKEHKLKLLELADSAASSISDGDLVDRMIHGSQQQWSLMPTHAIFSFVRPASFMFGNMMERPAFTSWLGQNSKQGKLSRYVKEIQGRMRLRASGDRHEVRQQYIPLLWDRLVKRLMVDGKDSVEEVVDFMDSYFLTRDDWDALVELGLGPMDESKVKLETQTKAAFTRVYNQRSHPLPYMKASNVLAPKKAPKEKPDIEDAIDESDEDDVLVDDTKDDEDSDEIDLKKDKLIRVPKKSTAKKSSAKSSTSAKGKGKSKKTSADDFIDDEDDDAPKPKKARGKKAKS
ncbi:replication factor RFC1 C terminal domain-containing protein [Aspergillus tetrazonus]